MIEGGAYCLAGVGAVLFRGGGWMFNRSRFPEFIQERPGVICNVASRDTAGRRGSLAGPR